MTFKGPCPKAPSSYWWDQSPPRASFGRNKMSVSRGIRHPRIRPLARTSLTKELVHSQSGRNCLDLQFDREVDGIDFHLRQISVFGFCRSRIIGAPSHKRVEAVSIWAKVLGNILVAAAARSAIRGSRCR